MGRRLRWRSRPDEGAAAVEFALVSILLITLVFGIIQYGYYFFQLNAGTSAAREAARLAAVGLDDCDSWGDESKDRASGVDTDSLTYSLSFEPATPTVGGKAVVQVSFPPSRFGPGIPLPSGDIFQQAKIRVEQVNTGQPSTCTYP
ncbi:MAG: TadE family protein [Actinomycetes bacterium]